MLIISGTKRSGTSLWMQMAIAAGFEPIGTAFPRTWRQHLHDHNPGGFYESTLRDGIYHKTNPNPETGRYLHPDATRRHVVKVFLPGLAKSDHAFLDRVVVSVRDWREVVASLRRMRAHEAQVFRWAELEKPIHILPPEVEWLTEHFLAVRDVLVRQYPAMFVGHRALLADPEGTLDQVFTFLGPIVPDTLDRDAVRAVVRPALHRNVAPDISDVVFDDATIAALDAFVAAVDAGGWRDPAILGPLNEAWTRAREAGWLKERLIWSDPRIIGVRTEDPEPETSYSPSKSSATE